MAYGELLKERSISGKKGLTLNDLSNSIVDALYNKWQSANPEFKEDENLIARLYLFKKVKTDWDFCVKWERKSSNQVESYKKRLDKLYNVLKCKCVFTTCAEKDCPDSCCEYVHINCTCVKIQKIPKVEIRFIYDQITKIGSKGQLQMSGQVDKKESAKIGRKVKREEKQKQPVEQPSLPLFDPELITSDESDAPESDAIDPGFAHSSTDRKLKPKTQNRIKCENLAREAFRCGVSNRDASLIATATLIDVGLISKENTSLIIDRKK